MDGWMECVGGMNKRQKGKKVGRGSSRTAFLQWEDVLLSISLPLLCYPLPTPFLCCCGNYYPHIPPSLHSYHGGIYVFHTRQCTIHIDARYARYHGAAAKKKGRTHQPLTQRDHRDKALFAWTHDPSNITCNFTVATKIDALGTNNSETHRSSLAIVWCLHQPLSILEQRT